MPQLLRVAPSQCVTLEPRHVRPQWRIIVEAIVYCFLKRKRVGFQLSSAARNQNSMANRPTMNFSSHGSIFARAGDGGDLEERAYERWRPGGVAR
jgi:hypothetical protein